MFIKSLTLKNFRCFGKGDDEKGTKIELNSGVTAFIGRNGSGKTSIIEAINFLVGQEYLPSRISEKDFHNEANNIKDEIYLEAETENPFILNIDARSNYGQLESVAIPCNGIYLTIKRREKPEKVLDDPFVINKYVIPVLGDIDENIYDQDEKARKATRITKIREGFTVFFKLKDGQERDIKIINYQLTYNPNKLSRCPKSYYLTTERDKDVAGNYSLIAKILTDLHWKYRKKQIDDVDIKPQYSNLAESLRSIIDEKGVLINKINGKVNEICCEDKNFQIDFIDIEQPYKFAFVAKKEGEKVLLPDNLGSGFNILIAYALFSYVAEQEKVPIILLIDEPELHLHCDWQKKMYDSFTNNDNLQIIYSTQSENFVSLKNWKQIRLIKDLKLYPNDEILSEQITATDNQTAERSAFLDDIANKNLHISSILKENLELFFTKKCILVEGPSEKYALPKLLGLNGCKFENYSVSIIPAWGKTKIKNYQMICKCFGIDYYTIFDNDKKADDEPMNESNAIETNAQSGKFTKFSTSFETLLGITGDKKFQLVVRKTDDLQDMNGIGEEIKTCLKNVQGFVEAI